MSKRATGLALFLQGIIAVCIFCEFFLFMPNH